MADLDAPSGVDKGSKNRFGWLISPSFPLISCLPPLRHHLFCTHIFLSLYGDCFLSVFPLFDLNLMFVTMYIALMFPDIRSF